MFFPLISYHIFLFPRLFLFELLTPLSPCFCVTLQSLWRPAASGGLLFKPDVSDQDSVSGLLFQPSFSCLHPHWSQVSPAHNTAQHCQNKSDTDWVILRIWMNSAEVKCYSQKKTVVKGTCQEKVIFQMYVHMHLGIRNYYQPTHCEMTPFLWFAFVRKLLTSPSYLATLPTHVGILEMTAPRLSISTWILRNIVAIFSQDK